MAQGVPGRLRHRIFLTFQYYNGGKSSAKHTGRLYPKRNPWYSLSEAESTSGHMVLSGVPRKKSPVTPPGIDTRDRQTNSAAPLVYSVVPFNSSLLTITLYSGLEQHSGITVQYVQSLS